MKGATFAHLHLAALGIADAAEREAAVAMIEKGWAEATGDKATEAGWMRFGEVVALARCSPATVRAWVRAGYLMPRQSRRGVLYFSRREVARFLWHRVAVPAEGRRAAWRRLAQEAAGDAHTVGQGGGTGADADAGGGEIDAARGGAEA